MLTNLIFSLEKKINYLVINFVDYLQYRHYKKSSYWIIVFEVGRIISLTKIVSS